MKVELHCHSHYSKGEKIPWEAFMSPRDIMKLANRKGIFGVAITDHDTTGAWKEAKRAAKEYGIVFISGIEISTKNGHVLGVGLNEHIPKKLPLEDTVEMIHDQGGISVAAHPYDIRGQGVKGGVKHVDAVEVFNAMNLDRLSNMLAFNKAEEHGKSMVAGSDSHTSDMFGLAVNEVDAYDADGVISEIRKGKVTLDAEYMGVNNIMNWSKERLLRSYMDVMTYMNNHYSWPRAWVSKKAMRNFVLSRSNASERFWRFMTNLGYGFSVAYSTIRFLAYY